MTTNQGFNSTRNNFQKKQYQDGTPCPERILHSAETLYPLANKVGAASIEKCLPKKSILRLKGDHSGEKIHISQGVIWITQIGDPKDIILWPDESYEVTKNSGLLIQAMPGTDIKITRTHHGPSLGHFVGQVTGLLGHEL